MLRGNFRCETSHQEFLVVLEIMSWLKDSFDKLVQNTIFLDERARSYCDRAVVKTLTRETL